MKIHISSETHAALQQFNSFDMEERGKVEMKVGIRQSADFKHVKLRIYTLIIADFFKGYTAPLF